MEIQADTTGLVETEVVTTGLVEIQMDTTGLMEIGVKATTDQDRRNPESRDMETIM